MKFSGKNVLVTGSSRGIGAEVAKVLASYGLKVWINYRSGAAEADAIKNAIEATFGVNVVAVNTMNYRADRSVKYTKSGLISGKTNAYKKAVVQVQEGETIDFYTNI